MGPTRQKLFALACYSPLTADTMHKMLENFIFSKSFSSLMFEIELENEIDNFSNLDRVFIRL